MTPGKKCIVLQSVEDLLGSPCDEGRGANMTMAVMASLGLLGGGAAVHKLAKASVQAPISFSVNRAPEKPARPAPEISRPDQDKRLWRADFPAFVARMENDKGLGYRLNARGEARYFPVPSFEGGMPTIGFGTKIRDKAQLKALEDGVSAKVAQQMLEEELAESSGKVNAYVKANYPGKTLFSLPIEAREILTEFMFNLGNLKSFKAFADAVVRGDWETALKEHKRYARRGGKGRALSLDERNFQVQNRYLRLVSLPRPASLLSDDDMASSSLAMPAAKPAPYKAQTTKSLPKQKSKTLSKARSKTLRETVGGVTVEQLGRAVSRVAHSNESFDILDADGGGGDWSAGGCLILADAIMLVLPKVGMTGELVALAGKNGMEHAMVRVGDKLLDARGARTGSGVRKYWKHPVDNLGPVRIAKMDSVAIDDEIPRRPVASRKIARMILKELGLS